MGSTESESWRVEVERFFDRVADLMLGDDPRVTLLGPYASASTHLMNRVAQVTRSVWNMQWTANVEGMRRAMAVEADHGFTRLDDRDIYPPEGLASSPLIPPMWPRARIGWVPAPMLVTDEEHVFLAGPRGTRYARTIWSSGDPGLVDAAAAVYLRCWEAARPWQAVTDRPRLEGRTLQAALEMATGSTDQEIATALGVGQRTAAAEVRRVIDWCGARSRGHAIAILVGADR